MSCWSISQKIKCANADSVVSLHVGFRENGGPFSLLQLKVIQEVTTLVVFVVFSLAVFKNDTFRLNHLIGFIFLVLAVYFIFKK